MKEKDHLGLYLAFRQNGNIEHHSKYSDGGFYILESGNKFTLYDCGEYGDYENAEGVFDSLEDAFNVGKTWT